MTDEPKNPASARILIPEFEILRPRGWHELSGISAMYWLPVLLAIAGVTDWGVS
jgi:hypothetical protein